MGMGHAIVANVNNGFFFCRKAHLLAHSLVLLYVSDDGSCSINSFSLILGTFVYYYR